jgi:hypothetical protein
LAGIPFHFTNEVFYYISDLQIFSVRFLHYRKYEMGGFKYKTEPKAVPAGFSFEQ